MLRGAPRRPEGWLREEPRRAQEATAQGPRPALRSPVARQRHARYVAGRLRAARKARLTPTRALLDAFGVEMPSPSEFDLTLDCVERARAERGGRRWPSSSSGTTECEGRRPVALSLEASRGGTVPHGPRTHRDISPRILHLSENALTAQGVSLKLEISRPKRGCVACQAS